MKRLLLLAALCVPLAGCDPEERLADDPMRARIEARAGKLVTEMTPEELTAEIQKDTGVTVLGAHVDPDTGALVFVLPPIGGEIAKVVLDTASKVAQDNPTPAAIPGALVAVAMAILALIQRRGEIGVKK